MQSFMKIKSSRIGKITLNDIGISRTCHDISTSQICLILKKNSEVTVQYSYGVLFNCATVGQASDSMTALT